MNTSNGTEEFTVRAYMPFQAPAEIVHDAFIRIAERRFRAMARTADEPVLAKTA
jgi:hypothetical protein